MHPEKYSPTLDEVLEAASWGSDPEDTPKKITINTSRLSQEQLLQLNPQEIDGGPHKVNLLAARYAAGLSPLGDAAKEIPQPAEENADLESEPWDLVEVFGPLIASEIALRAAKRAQKLIAKQRKKASQSFKGRPATTRPETLFETYIPAINSEEESGAIQQAVFEQLQAQRQQDQEIPTDIQRKTEELRQLGRML